MECRMETMRKVIQALGLKIKLKKPVLNWGVNLKNINQQFAKLEVNFNRVFS